MIADIVLGIPIGLLLFAWLVKMWLEGEEIC